MQHFVHSRSTSFKNWTVSHCDVFTTKISSRPDNVLIFSVLWNKSKIVRKLDTNFRLGAPGIFTSFKHVRMQMIQSPPGFPDWLLGPPDIHVWTFSLDVSPSVLIVLEGFLSPAEIERARRFVSDQHRNRFKAGRGIMRILLSRYVREEPGKLEFNYGPHGKPFLAGAFAQSQLHFNLAHAERLALLAVARGGPIGVDLEKIRPITEADQLATDFFPSLESDALRNLPPEEKAAAFLNLWTRKEAVLKAEGRGLGNLPHEKEPARSILRNFEPVPGFVAALAVLTEIDTVFCSCWDEEATRKILENLIGI